MVSINDADPSGRRGSSASSVPGTTVSTGRALPTGVGAPVFLESPRSPRGYDPPPVSHRFQALLATHKETLSRRPMVCAPRSQDIQVYADQHEAQTARPPRPTASEP